MQEKGVNDQSVHSRGVEEITAAEITAESWKRSLWQSLYLHSVTETKHLDMAFTPKIPFNS